MSKLWYKSKTVISAVVFTALSVYEIATGDVSTVTAIIKALATGGIIYGFRDAIDG